TGHRARALGDNPGAAPGAKEGGVYHARGGGGGAKKVGPPQGAQASPVLETLGIRPRLRLGPDGICTGWFARPPCRGRRSRRSRSGTNAMPAPGVVSARTPNRL